MSIFRSFRSTVAPFLSRQWPNNPKLLVDPITGAPAGIESPNANGADGIWTPIDLSPAQVASPSAEMIADLNAVYRMNIPPYHRYRSEGVGGTLVGEDDSNVQKADGMFGTMIVWSPYTVTDPAGEIIRGTMYVRSVPA